VRLLFATMYVTRLVDVRYSVLYFLARKSPRCTSHISPDSVRLVDVRYSALCFLTRKITRCTSHISLQFVFKGVVPGRVNGRRTRQCTDIFHSVGRCAIFGFVFLGKKHHSSYRTSRPILFGWSMCDIRFCIYCPETSQDAHRIVKLRA